MDNPPTNLVQRQLAVIVIPTFDEKSDIADIIRESLLEQNNITQFELSIVVADSQSQDGTAEIVEELAKIDSRIHLISVHERGIGLGLLSGFKYSIEVLGADVLIEMDADFQHNPSDIPRLINELARGFDVVIGSRFVEGSVNKMPWYRQILSIGANQIIRSMLGLQRIKEITTSYRAFTKDIFLRIPLESVPWKEKSFIAVPILLVRMVESDAKVSEIPMTMHPRMRGYSKMVYWRYMRDIAWFLVKSWFSAHVWRQQRNS